MTHDQKHSNFPSPGDSLRCPVLSLFPSMKVLVADKISPKGVAWLRQQPGLERLLALQSKEGGWITDYDEQRKPLGMANVETTCLAILALDAVAKAL